MRFLICFSILMFFMIRFSCCHGQAYMMLWYLGHKINDTTLQNNKGQTISYSRHGNKVIVNTPTVKDLLAVAIKELKNSPQRKKQVIYMIRQAWPSKYQGDNFGGNYTPHINKAMDDADKQFSGIDNKIIQLPPATLKPVEGTPAEQSEKIPPEIESAYKAIMKYIAEIKSAAIESPPNPPSIGFDYCYPCDKQRQATYLQDSVKFMKYIEREQEMLLPAFMLFICLT